ncbi:MAG: triosephosphate isomerase [Betaproteobacteria bacterium]|nr:MAG: triosephosphate isomerase [Betaproteobacteria bacterium]
MRGRLVVGNWKMNGDTASNARLLDAIARGWQAAADRGLAVCVPFPYLAQARERLAGSAVAWGAQDVSEHPSGAHTGEVSAAMVAEFGSRYAIVGHSERRQAHGESDALVAAKAAAALAADLVPVVCVGETLAEREAGATSAVVTRQIDAVIAALGPALARCVVAYEPVWAIGTGRTATPEQAQEVHALLRRRLAAAGAGSIALLYGGSVKAANAASLFGMPDVDGGLVGGASLDADEFLAIGAA